MLKQSERTHVSLLETKKLWSIESAWANVVWGLIWGIVSENDSESDKNQPVLCVLKVLLTVRSVKFETRTFASKMKRGWACLFCLRTQLKYCIFFIRPRDCTACSYDWWCEFFLNRGVFRAVFYGCPLGWLCCWSCAFWFFSALVALGSDLTERKMKRRFIFETKDKKSRKKTVAW